MSTQTVARQTILDDLCCCIYVPCVILRFCKLFSIVPAVPTAVPVLCMSSRIYFSYARQWYRTVPIYILNWSCFGIVPVPTYSMVHSSWHRTAKRNTGTDIFSHFCCFWHLSIFGASTLYCTSSFSPGFYIFCYESVWWLFCSDKKVWVFDFIIAIKLFEYCLQSVYKSFGFAIFNR